MSGDNKRVYSYKDPDIIDVFLEYLKERQEAIAKGGGAKKETEKQGQQEEMPERQPPPAEVASSSVDLSAVAQGEEDDDDFEFDFGASNAASSSSSSSPFSSSAGNAQKRHPLAQLNSYLQPPTPVARPATTAVRVATPTGRPYTPVVVVEHSRHSPFFSGGSEYDVGRESGLDTNLPYASLPTRSLGSTEFIPNPVLREQVRRAWSGDTGEIERILHERGGEAQSLYLIPEDFVTTRASELAHNVVEAYALLLKERFQNRNFSAHPASADIADVLVPDVFQFGAVVYGGHWILIRALLSEGMVDLVVFDSLPAEDVDYLANVRTIELQQRFTYYDVHCWGDKRCPKQRDGTSCGVFVCFYMRCLAKYGSVTDSNFTAAHIPLLRAMLAAELLMGRLLTEEEVTVWKASYGGNETFRI